ncbi:MAG: hypothetical protein C4538_00510 [Nitrospiraceae bacterium]|nr:MAG: hypothetical protein C4538_00510 [Nitrospiraceae bacterium]
MDKKHSLGGDIEAMCTKCKLELGHTIIAMVDDVPERVKCNTCNGEHNYRTKSPKKPRTRLMDADRKARSREAHYNEQMSRITGGDLSKAKKYSMEDNFKKDELIDHPAFGLGIVLSVTQKNKMEILFKDGPKLLIQNREAAVQ